ncbi:hypothetical protein HMPREF0682_2340 [Propionibacterium acidifaciens F0233]|uniref:Uncharacterized protein n=1 Tax=Propionibacterium acidifaciens F0233 TaxID=553198 RepID=U2R8H7_9ACTN|nr:hypothetical protein HMPREF0682_2340 [Propionibacterium acidifaciens F0233]
MLSSERTGLSGPAGRTVQPGGHDPRAVLVPILSNTVTAWEPVPARGGGFPVPSRGHRP